MMHATSYLLLVILLVSLLSSPYMILRYANYLPTYLLPTYWPFPLIYVITFA
ncbi:hypothetical protein B0H63DRAFT_460352 [Podospora didyma]|uniref:Uncharacterized protein n=1 Tax=Podospora didyma TaxID=330526 RepID=A0AAE0P6I6_9PEZI|nr:hypothetical protein B0H63DRAFT_460352 [Podospora didyma]